MIPLMRRVQLMVFDLDGTLAATGEDLAASVNYALAAQGLPCLPTDRVIGFVGDGLRELMIRVLGPGEEWRLESSLDLFTEHHDRHLLDHTALYPGVQASLDFFRNKKKIVLTNKRWHFADKILRSLGIGDYFDAVIGGDCHPYMKPDARLIPPILDRFSTTPELTVMVGTVGTTSFWQNKRVSSVAPISGIDRPSGPSGARSGLCHPIHVRITRPFSLRGFPCFSR